MRIKGVLFISLTAAVIACGRPEQSNSDGSANPSVIALDGSSTVFPITEAVAEEFQKANAGQRVTVGLSGTSGGFQKFCRGETVMSNASRPILQAEIDACRNGGVTYIELPVAYDGLTVVVHPNNNWATSMTVAELKRLWEPAAQGKILRWNQIRASWPNQEIHLFGAGVDSGTFDYFTEVINGKAKASRGDYTSSEDDNILVQGVAGDQFSLGYMGLAYYAENKGRMKLVAIDDENADNGAGPIEPSLETVRGGTYRPLSRPLFIYVSVSALGRPEVAKLAQFYLDSGPPLIQEVGYVPLATAELDLVKQRFAARTTGTMFDPAAPMNSLATLEQRLRGQR